jgi:ubiquinone/menaquinone biosynthesis C-methylase UbiE
MYDARRFTGSPRRELYAARERDLIVRLLEPRDSLRILDIGTGTGRAAQALAETSGAMIVGADLSLGMLMQAVHKREQAGTAYPLFVGSNARLLPFQRDTFDVVLCIRVLHLFPPVHWGAFIDEMLRVLKPGGRLLVEFDSPLAGFGWALAREARWRRQGNRPRYYLWPRQVAPLFAGTEEREVFGFWFPGIGLLAQRGGRFRHALALAHLTTPFGYLGNKILVRARKPPASAAVVARPLAVAAGMG